MPIYPFKCGTCGREQDVFCRIAERDESAPECCGAKTLRQLSAPMVSIPGEVRYRCPVTDAVVTSERQRRNIMAEHRLVDANDLTPKYITEQKQRKTAANAALAAELTKDIPKEIVQQAQEMAAA